MRHFWMVLMMAACAAACSTPPPPGVQATSETAAQLYSEAVDDLIAATRTQGAYQSTSMRELEPCKFAFSISPGRQSTLQYAFDVRHLNLRATSAATGQAGEGEFVSSAVSCAKKQGRCVSYIGMAVSGVEIVSPTPEDMDRALNALRQAKSACLAAPPAFFQE